MRLSATDWAEGPQNDPDMKYLQWDIQRTVLLTGELKNLGIDVISGDSWAARKIPVQPG